MSGLSPSQKELYSQLGYLVVPGFLPIETCQTLRERAAFLVDGFDPQTVSIFSTKNQSSTTDDYFLNSGRDIRFFFEEEAFLPNGQLRQEKAHSINKIGHALHTLDPVFSALSASESILGVVRDLGMKSPVQLQSMYIFKNPFIGGDVACHQDGTFLYTEPESVTGLWFALEDATVENGCLWALPGGHVEPLRRRFVRTPGGKTQMLPLHSAPLPDVAPSVPWVPVEVPAGTLVLLHGRLPHWSGANRSPKSRHAYAVHVVDAACHYPDDNWLQPGPVS
ncbi:MAG: phytanoyl-CoA dioxygenase family protein [Polyangiaceae bacterium]|nr:phytanoyl-CoA dioxygenase family protein [Polyangiaceae bacterium]